MVKCTGNVLKSGISVYRFAAHRNAPKWMKIQNLKFYKFPIYQKGQKGQKSKKCK